MGDKKSSTTAESELNKGFEDLVVDGGRYIRKLLIECIYRREYGERIKRL